MGVSLLAGGVEFSYGGVERGAWSVEHGAWSVEHGAWNVERGWWMWIMELEEEGVDQDARFGDRIDRINEEGIRQSR